MAGWLLVKKDDRVTDCCPCDGGCYAEAGQREARTEAALTRLHAR